MTLNIKNPRSSALLPSLLRVLEQEIWPQVPAGELGRESLSRAERESLLGDGSEGV
jgi:hypothetical protein